MTIKDSFRIYDCPERSFCDFLLFLTFASNYGAGCIPKYGQEVLSITDPEKLITEVGGRGYATGKTYPKSVMRIVNRHNLTQYDDLTGVTASDYLPKNYWEQKSVNSPLVSYTRISPNQSGKRTHKIDRITPHCYVGQVTVQDMAAWLCNPSASASCNYGIGKDGAVGLIVPEDCRSWCSTSRENDQRAVTIECASDKYDPYAFNSAVYATLIDLCVDICQRNGKKKLLWLADKDRTLSYSPAEDEMVLTVHRWFAAKSCPGPWMFSRMGDLASKVTARLNGESDPDEPVEKVVSFRVQAGVFSIKRNAEELVATIKDAGFPAIIKTEKGQYVVQCGSFSKRSNAKALKKKLKQAGIHAIIKKIEV